jgi:hypothetical protein
MRPLKDSTSLFERRPTDPAMFALYKSYNEASRLYVLRACIENRLFYVQTGSGGEGQRYEVRTSEGKILETLDVETIHSMTYRKSLNYLDEVPLYIRLGPAGDYKLFPTNDGIKFLSKHHRRTTYESLEALNEDFRSEVEKLRGNVSEAVSVGGS